MFRQFDNDRSGHLSFAEFVLGFGTVNHEKAIAKVRVLLLLEAAEVIVFGWA